MRAVRSVSRWCSGLVVVLVLSDCAGQAQRSARPVEEPLPSTSSVADEQLTRCARVRLPRQGLGEADFSVDRAAQTLQMNFSDYRRGEYRNVSYTVRYLQDPTCSSDHEVAHVISRVGPPGWPPIP